MRLTAAGQAMAGEGGLTKHPVEEGNGLKVGVSLSSSKKVKSEVRSLLSHHVPNLE